MEWINIILSVGSAIVIVAIAWGSMSTEIAYLKKTIDELKAEVKDFRKLNEDLAVVKNDIHSIKDMLSRIIEDNQ